MICRPTPILVTTLAAAVALGCTAEVGSGTTTARASRADVRWSDDVLFPERDPAFLSVRRVGGTQMLFTFEERPAFAPAAGDLVTGGVDGGYLARVRDLEWIDDRTVRLETEGASLTDAIVDLDLHYESAVEDTVTGEFEEGSEVGGRSAALTETLRFGLGPHSEILLSDVHDAEVSFEDSHFEVSPDMEADLVIRDRELEMMRFEVEACADFHGVVSIEAHGDVSSGVVVTLPMAIRSPLFIERLPALYEIEPRVRLDIAMREGTRARGGVDITTCFRAGARYDGDTDTFHPIWEPTLTTTRIGPELRADSEVSVKLGAGPRVTLYLLGTAGPTMALTEYGRLAVTRDDEGLGWGLHAGVEAEVGIQTRGGRLFRGIRFSHTIPLAERRLASGRIGGEDPAECRRNVDCPEDEYCDASHQCVPIYDESEPECRSDGDCSDLERCDGGSCIRWVECTEDSDCESGEECVDSACVTRSSGGGGGAVECRADSDCSDVERCDGGTCVRWAECVDDAHCTGDEACIDYTCVAPSGGTACGGLPVGENGDPCTSEGTWRCACSATWGDISQVCRDGIWQSYSTSPSDCSTCSAAYGYGCAP